MTKTDTRDVERTLEQVLQLQEAGCELIRLAVPDLKAARALGRITAGAAIPVAADIHFDHRLAREALDQGVHKLRLNPGNLRKPEHIQQLARHAMSRNVPIRVGVNAGSLDPRILARDGGVTARGLVESALGEIRLLEAVGFHDIVISLKASEVPLTVEAYSLLAREVDYPFHIGITEAGPPPCGLIASSVGIGCLLAAGLGDTVRVSLTAHPLEEVRAAYEILKSLNMRQRGAVLVSCPTCGRTEIDVPGLAAAVAKRVEALTTPLRLAVMGCVVNGPGEARAADLGLAGGKGRGVIFRKGEILCTVKEDELLSAFLAELDRLLEERAQCAQGPLPSGD